MCEYTVEPFALAQVALDELTEEQSTAFVDALIADGRALGCYGAGWDHERRRISSTFQVEASTAAEATRLAFEVYDAALVRAGIEACTVGLALVAGADPELLPV